MDANKKQVLRDSLETVQQVIRSGWLESKTRIVFRVPQNNDKRTSASINFRKCMLHQPGTDPLSLFGSTNGHRRQPEPNNRPRAI